MLGQACFLHFYDQYLVTNLNGISICSIGSSTSIGPRRFRPRSRSARRLSSIRLWRLVPSISLVTRRRAASRRHSARRLVSRRHATWPRKKENFGSMVHDSMWLSVSKDIMTTRFHRSFQTSFFFCVRFISLHFCLYVISPCTL